MFCILFDKHVLKFHDFKNPSKLHIYFIDIFFYTAKYDH